MNGQTKRNAENQDQARPDGGALFSFFREGANGRIYRSIIISVNTTEPNTSTDSDISSVKDMPLSTLFVSMFIWRCAQSVLSSNERHMFRLKDRLTLED